MPKRDAPPPPILTMQAGKLSPATAWDAELLAGYPSGASFDLIHRTRRSKPHNAKYWAILGRIVKATEVFPSAEKMHEWVKLRLGYVSPVFGPKGEIVGMTIDSTAFDAMDQQAFNLFYERFAGLVAKEMGINIGDVE
jgi:hypothetical protein